MTYLVHHGIKGQKWGVKQGPPYPLDESDHTAAEKKADRNIVKKGTEFQRISTVKEKHPNKDRTYLAYKSADKDYYMENMTDFRRGRDKARNIYKISYKAVNDIIYPTHEKQVEEFMKLYKNKKLSVINDISEEMSDRYSYAEYGKRTKENAEDWDYTKNFYKKRYQYILDDNNVGGDYIKKVGYREFVAAYDHIPISKVYQKNLIRQGFNAIRDDNDVLYNNMFKGKPTDSLVVFEPQKNLKITKAKKLKNSEYKKAKQRNKERYG